MWYSFHVVVPSLPGYFKSTLPQMADWDNMKVASVFHHLMKDVLGYTTYAGQGGDWVSTPLTSFKDYQMCDSFPIGQYDSRIPWETLS